MSSADFSDVIQLACQASLRGDGSAVANSLRSTRCIPTGIDLQLLPASPISHELLGRLASSRPVLNCNVDLALRALLLVSPCYETPWRAVVVLIERLHAKSGWLGESANAIFAGIADVQTFLQQTLSLWWRQESYDAERITLEDSIESTPRHWLLRMAKVALRPLHDDTAAVSASDNMHWVIPLDLVTTVVSLCQELEGMSSITSQAILDEILRDPVDKSRILPLLSMARDLHVRLRHVDWLKLQSLVREALETRAIPFADMPGIARSVIFLSEQSHRWMPLLLLLLHAASNDMATYSTLETVIRFSLASQSTQSLYEWQSVLPTEGLPSWIIGNYYLLLFQAARQTGSEVVARLLRNALGESEKAYDCVDGCVQSLVCLCLPKLSRDRRKCQVQSLVRFLDGVRYEGEGQFSRKSQLINGMELTVLVQSLYLGATKLEHRRHKLSAAERAQAWIHAAMSMLEKADFASKVSAILIFVSVFCDVPSSRSTLVRSMVGDGKSLDEVDCCIIGTLVRSLTEESDMQALDPISSFITSRTLPFDTFRLLADTFALTASGRESILSFSQKHLYVQNIPWWATTDNEGKSERKQTTQSALYGLCALLAKWDHVALNAWSILSDFLVAGKPSLPLAIRSWLYCELRNSLILDKFPASVADHLLRALLTRLLTFFDWTNDERQLKFIPERAVTSFHGSQKPLVREDLSSLFGLVVELLLKSARDNVVEDASTESCRLKLQSICTNQTNATFVFGDTINSAFYFDVVSSLLASSTSYVFSKVSSDQSLRGIVSIEPSLKTVAELIAKEEKRSLNTCPSSPPSACNEMPRWLTGISTSRCGRNSVVQPPDLCASICCVVCLFVSRAFVALDSERQVMLASSISCMFKCRQRMEPLNRGTLGHELSFIQYISPEILSLFSDVLVRMFTDEPPLLGDLELIMAGLEQVCDDISSLPQATPHNCRQADEAVMLFGAISLLYRRVASESPTSQLLCYLEKKHSLSQSTRADANGLLVCSGSAATDRVVHVFRTKVLGALATCIKAVSNGHIEEVTTVDASFLQKSHALTIKGIEASAFISQLLQSTAEDLLDGLRLLSGGITSKMYILFVEIIETACTLILRGVQCVREHKSIDNAVQATSLLVNNIMCDFTIPAPLFKKTIDLALLLLPSLRRGFAMRCFTEKLTVGDMPTAFFTNISTQVLQMLMDRSSDCAISWSQPTGPDILTGDDDIDSEPGEQTIRIPLEITIPSASVARTTFENNTVVKMANEAAWSHALNALCMAADRSFTEASLRWQNCENDDCPDADLLQCPGYLFWRREEDSLFMNLICRCLQHAKTESNEVTPVKVLAQYMPKASKVKFLVALDKIIMFLAKALRLSMKWIQKGAGISSLAMAEIIAVVAAWASDDTLDLITGARRWFQAERHGSTNSREVDKVIGRLPKTMLRVDELESVLQKLDAAMLIWKDKESSPQASRLEVMEHAMMLALSNDATPPRLQRNVSLSQVVSKRLQSATASRVHDFVSYYAESEGLQEGLGDSDRKRKRQNALAKRMRRERNQPIPRSRNPVIDLYQQLDYDDAFNDDDDFDDAYADLEGFLVEG